MASARSARELNEEFGIRGAAEISEGNGGLARVRVITATASGEMYLHGGHVTAWQPVDAEEVLFLSGKSKWQSGKAIRGGVPICFPWFGDKAGDSSAPAHGFVRSKAWRLEGIVQAGDSVTVSMFTESDESSQRWWPADFQLTHNATFGRELSLELVMKNTGAARLRFEEALHTYLRIGDVEKAQVRGLDGLRYLDKTDSNREKAQSGDLLLRQLTDSIYLNTEGTVTVDDPAMNRRIQVAKENSLTTVVWNPWAQKAKEMSDIGDEEWKQMICVECTNVGPFAVDLAPGAQHAMKTVISVKKL